MKKKNRVKEWDKEILFLCLLMLAGAILRLYNLGYNSLWLDEATTYYLSVVPLGEIWAGVAQGEFNPPLFRFIEHFLLLLSHSEVALRIMPAVFGIITIPIIYFVGVEFRDKYVGLIVAAAFAFSPFLIFYSQDARAYSLLLLLCAATMLFFLKAMKTNQRSDWCRCAVFAALAFWTHFYALVFLVAIISYAAWRFRKNLESLVVGTILWFLLLLPLLPALVTLISRRASEAPTYGIKGVGIVIETFKQISGFSDILALITLALFVGGIYWTLKQKSELGVLLLWMIGVILSASYAASFLIPMLPRYLIFLTIPLYLGVALLYEPLRDRMTFGDKNRSVYAVLYFILFFGLVAIPFCQSYYTSYSKEDWRGISQDLSQLTKDGDVVIAVPNYILQPLWYYYNSTEDRTILNGLSTAEGLEVARQTIKNTTYYIVTPDIAAVDTEMKAGVWLMKNSKIVKSYGGVTILRSNPHV